MSFKEAFIKNLPGILLPPLVVFTLIFFLAPVPDGVVSHAFNNALTCFVSGLITTIVVIRSLAKAGKLVELKKKQ